MKFKDFLRENSSEKHAVLAFGRMNPPTTGHEVLVNKVKSIAQKVGGTHHVVLSATNDAKKNPLTPQQKLKHAKRFFPNTNLSIAEKEAPTFLEQAKKLHKQGVTHLHMVAGSDRIPEYKKLLDKYNGEHEGALFNFKKVTLHSAGERDPDAEGTEGMSASKMRQHASTGNYLEFKKGIPGHVADHHARELYMEVRKGSKISEEEELNLDFEDLLVEGVHDKSIFKAVFLAGGPGSGKDYVLDNTLSGHGLTEINSDKALEFLMDKKGLDKTMPPEETEIRDAVRGKAKTMTELRQRLALFGRNGLIINGTGDDHEKIARIKKGLEELGYDTSMLMVNTRDEVSAQRNVERGQRGGRTVPEEIRREKWQSVQNARPELAKMFGQNYMEIDNSEDLRQADPETVKNKKQEMLDIYKNVQEFVNTPPKSEAAQNWVALELDKKDTLPVPQDGHDQTPHPDSSAAEEARNLGLQYYGFGRYGKNGEVTHRSVHDKLVEVQKKQPDQPNIPTSGTSMTAPKSVNEEFENFLEVELDEGNKLNKVKLMRDKDGKVRKFVLRRAAAKEAHQKNGTVMPYKNGYVIKLHEENEDAESTIKPIQEQTPTTTGSGNESGRSKQLTISETGTVRTGKTKEEPCTCSNEGEETCSKETKPTTEETRTKITISQIRAKQKEKGTVKESIDFGTEPGLSMASGGENMSRGVSNKNKPKQKPLEELTGDETTASISDKKEDELKKVGISLSTFKSKRVV